MAKTNDDFILPFLHKEFTSATRDWTDAEVGAYTRLLIVQWDQGSIPADINRIRKIADSIDSTQVVVLPKFKKAEQDGRLQNLRMEEIRDEKILFQSKKSKSGKKGAEKRWQNDSKHDGKQIAFINEEKEEGVGKGEKEEERKIPPNRELAQKHFATHKPVHWSSEYMESEVDAWFDYYQTNGWMVGKNKMKDWKAAIRTWIRNDYNFSKIKNGTTKTNGSSAGIPKEQDYSTRL
jgi:uncharacterized protein YdaU (DUF1376 family)